MLPMGRSFVSLVSAMTKLESCFPSYGNVIETIRHTEVDDLGL